MSPGSGPAEAATAAKVLRLTAADAVLLALENNRDLLNVQLSRAVQKFSLKVAETKFNPDATITPYTDYHIAGTGTDRQYANSGVSTGVSMLVPTGGRFAVLWNNTVAGRHGNSYGSVLTVTFTQPLLKGAGVAVNRASVRMARNQEERSVLSLKSAIMSTISAVVRSYRSFSQAQRRLNISNRSLERAKTQMEVNQTLIETGRMAAQDLVQNETNVANRELNLTEAQNSLDAARLALIEILDIDSDVMLEAVENLTVHPADPQLLDLNHALETATNNRPDYLQALLSIENSETDLMLAKNNRLWDLSASISSNVSEFGDSYQNFGDFGTGDYRIGIDLSIPLGDLSRRQRYISARNALAQARNNLRELEQAVEISVRNAVREVEVRFQQVALARRSLELSERQFEVEQDKLNLGLSTNFQVSSFEEALVEARNGEVNAVIAFLNSLTGLDQTLGITLESWNVDIERMGG